MAALGPSPIPVAGRSPAGGALYEPRGFWDIATLNTAAGSTRQGPAGEINVRKLNRENFRNGARWPIILTRMVLCPVGYQLTEFDTTPDGTAVTYHNDAISAITGAEVIIAAPQRQNYNKRYLYSRSWVPRPTSDPNMSLVKASPYASSLFGVSRLAFDRPLVLPSKGALEIGVGGFIAPGAAFGVLSTPNLAPLDGWIHVEERGGIWPGSSRDKQIVVRATDHPTIFPWQPDSFGSTAGNTAQTIIPQAGMFTANEFLKQNPERGRAGGNVFEAINVFIDQITRDDAYQDSSTTDVPTSPIVPLACNVPCSARCRIGGTGEYWWRPNAPLALMFNELTPGLVYDLPIPITLTPGDCLDIALRMPWRASVLINDVPTTVSPQYQLGVAFTGFAVIEG